MLGVEQIRTLEDRIEKALAFIRALRDENAALQTKAEASDTARGRAEERAAVAESRVRELEDAIAAFKNDQAKIEEGILHALEKLDAFEDLVLRGSSNEPSAQGTPHFGQEEHISVLPSMPEAVAGAESLEIEGEEKVEEEPTGVATKPAPQPVPMAVPQSEPARAESKRPEPTRPVAPPTAPDELGIF